MLYLQKNYVRENQRTQSVAVSSKNFIKKIKTEFAPHTKVRTIIGSNYEMFQIREKKSLFDNAY
jgi:hypothetical protein